MSTRTFLFLALWVVGCSSSSPTNGPDAGDGGNPAQDAGGEGGPSTLCGNGVIDTGENCDGSNLNGSSCTALGFQSGTLKCTASCQFDASGCANAFTPAVVPSRTTCTAPCGVFFDATSTTGLANGDYVGASFDWDFDSTNVDPKGVHEQTIGFVVAHVFDAPGTYQVSLRVRDVAGNAGSITVPITVSAMTGPTIYVASSGSDTNDGKTMGSPMATLTKALAKYTSAQTSILLRRGDTFDMGKTTLTLNALKGPLLIGAYQDPSSPNTATPILSSTITYPPSSNYQAIIGIQNGSDLRFTDLHIKSTQASGALELATSTDTLLERIEIEGIGYEGQGDTVGQNFYVDAASTNSFFVDCHLHDFRFYGLYGNQTKNLAMIGTVMERFGGGGHGVRIQGGSPATTPSEYAMNTYAAENVFTSDQADPSADIFAARGDNKNTVYVGNQSNVDVQFQPQNLQAAEHVSLALVEGNTMYDPDTTDYAFQVALLITAQHVVVRNNLFVNAYTSVSVMGEALEAPNWVDQIAIYNNTHYVFPLQSNCNNGHAATCVYNNDSFSSIAHYDTTGSLTAQNNIFVVGLPDSASSILATDGKGTDTFDHNLIYAPKAGTLTKPNTGTGGVQADPKFASTDPTSPSAFRLTSGSPAIDVGAQTPAYRDFAGVARPVNAKWDIGAFEFTP